MATQYDTVYSCNQHMIKLLNILDTRVEDGTAVSTTELSVAEDVVVKVAT